MNRRIASEPKFNKHHKLMTEVNNLFIAIKIHQMVDQEGEDKIAKAKLRYPLPNLEENNVLCRKILSALEEFDTPLIKY